MRVRVTGGEALVVVRRPPLLEWHHGLPFLAGDSALMRTSSSQTATQRSHRPAHVDWTGCAAEHLHTPCQGSGPLPQTHATHAGSLPSGPPAWACAEHFAMAWRDPRWLTRSELDACLPAQPADAAGRRSQHCCVLVVMPHTMYLPALRL